MNLYGSQIWRYNDIKKTLNYCMLLGENQLEIYGKYHIDLIAILYIALIAVFPVTI